MTANGRWDLIRSLKGKSERTQIKGKGTALDCTRSVVATGWTVRGSFPGEGEIFCTRPTQPPIQWLPAISRG